MSRRTGRAWAASLALLLGGVLLGCASPGTAPFSADPGATLLLEQWLASSRGFDALEAYEMSGPAGSVRFGVARKWADAGVKVLSWTLRPAAAAGIGYLLLREPDRRPETFVYLPAGNGAGSRKVRRLSGVRPPPGDGSPLSLGSEVALVTLPGDFLAVASEEALFGGEVCDVVEGRPARRSRFVTHVRWWIARDSGVAMRKVYYRGEQELRRVDVVPESVREVGGRRLPHAWRIHTADGTQAEIELVNAIADVTLPESLFSQHTLKAQRFPKF